MILKDTIRSKEGDKVTIKISNDTETRLVIGFAEGIQNTKPEADYLSRTDFHWADDFLKDLPEDARTKIERYLGERGLSQFVQCEISPLIYRDRTLNSIKRGKPLGSLPFATNAIQLARELVEKLKKLPLRYRLTVALPAQFTTPLDGKTRDEFSLPSGITIALGRSLPQPLPVHADDSELDEDLFKDFWGLDDKKHEREIDPERYYISMPMLGYAVRYHSSALGRSFEDNLRAFYGAGIAEGLLDYGWKTKGDKRPFIMIHTEPGRDLIETEKLEDDLIDRENSCSTEAFATKQKDGLAAAFESSLMRIGTIFHENTDCRRLFTACVWFYRAKMNRRALDALLEATIAIEVMLGDRKAAEGVGLANLLGSRCAFLLGRSSSERENIMTKFRQVYELRSNIVHEGRHVLNVGDRPVVNSALAICASIIRRELRIRASQE